MRVLVTRPLQDAKATADHLRALGHEALISPLLEISNATGPIIDLSGVQALLVTSANGVRALSARTAVRDIPIFAVGPQTADEAVTAGFTNVRSSDRDATALAEAVAHWTAPEKGSLLHASGADGAGRLAGLLADKGFDVRTETLYSVSPVPLSQQALDAITTSTLGAVLLYSPRSARLFRDAIAGANLSEAVKKVTAVCISQAAAEALAPLNFAQMCIATTPNQKALLACLS
jgi:uroporphyrinogen-III synthase